jgi:hypothetical protein
VEFREKLNCMYNYFQYSLSKIIICNIPLEIEFFNRNSLSSSLLPQVVKYQMMRALLADLLSPLEEGSIKGVKNIFEEIAENERAEAEEKEKAARYLDQKSA